jgi:glycosyltransferase involved in cell wall biosynthesis
MHVKSKLSEIDCINTCSDSIVAVCQWLFDGLLANGIRPSKLSLSRQGLHAGFVEALKPVAEAKGFSPNASRPFVFGFLGRWDPVKGIDLAVKAFELLPISIETRLHIVATGATESSLSYRLGIIESLRNDSRVKIQEELDRTAIPAFFSSIDALLVPSRWLETGPMVILEAVAARVPVIGSGIGGIQELSLIYDNIYLPESDSPSSWAACMEMLATRFNSQMSYHVSPRTMDVVEAEMSLLYAS